MSWHRQCHLSRALSVEGFPRLSVIGWQPYGSFIGTKKHPTSSSITFFKALFNFDSGFGFFKNQLRSWAYVHYTNQARACFLGLYKKNSKHEQCYSPFSLNSVLPFHEHVTVSFILLIFGNSLKTVPHPQQGFWKPDVWIMCHCCWIRACIRKC